MNIIKAFAAAALLASSGTATVATIDTPNNLDLNVATTINTDVSSPIKLDYQGNISSDKGVNIDSGKIFKYGSITPSVDLKDHSINTDLDLNSFMNDGYVIDWDYCYFTRFSGNEIIEPGDTTESINYIFYLVYYSTDEMNAAVDAGTNTWDQYVAYYYYVPSADVLSNKNIRFMNYSHIKHEAIYNEIYVQASNKLTKQDFAPYKINGYKVYEYQYEVSPETITDNFNVNGSEGDYYCIALLENGQIAENYSTYYVEGEVDTVAPVITLKTKSATVNLNEYINDNVNIEQILNNIDTYYNNILFDYFIDSIKDNSGYVEASYDISCWKTSDNDYVAKLNKTYLITIRANDYEGNNTSEVITIKFSETSNGNNNNGSSSSEDTKSDKEPNFFIRFFKKIGDAIVKILNKIKDFFS